MDMLYMYAYPQVFTAPHNEQGNKHGQLGLGHFKNLCTDSEVLSVFHTGLIPPLQISGIYCPGIHDGTWAIVCEIREQRRKTLSTHCPPQSEAVHQAVGSARAGASDCDAHCLRGQPHRGAVCKRRGMCCDPGRRNTATSSHMNAC